MLKVSRRRFTAGAGSLLALPMIVPSGCVSACKCRRPLPSERIHVGMLGYGTMAQDNIGNFLHNERVQVIAVCDPVSEGPLYGYKAERMGGREPGRRKVNAFYETRDKRPVYNGCKVFNDFRDMLDDPALDAVCISTPDHWHALHTVWAAKKGKHIYGQKPLYLTLLEGRAMVKAVDRSGITFQTGAQSRSNDYFRMACELVRNNRIGKLQRVEVGLNKGHATFGKTPEQLSETPLAAPPPYVDFDLWLGPAPARPFTPKIHHPMQWRYNLDYSCGMLTDFAAHQLDIMQWALNKDGVEPVAIENIKGRLPPPADLYNTLAEPFSFEIVYGDGLRVFVSSEYAYGCRFYGENGKQIYATNGKLETQPAELVREKIGEDGVRLIRSGQQEKNFIDAIYSGAAPISPVTAGFSSLTPAVLAHIGMRLGRTSLKWLAAASRFDNDPEADKLLAPHMRGAWRLDLF
ncbi:MAG: Gfo/Idh/MocA family oxidoreductase [Kiritimatiellia bacterium]|jgi:predicted dehydrogenase|nr:Gfo/Idh/MocA family oxidoreductase [Kiritimatiellia bacterium]NLC82802.1 Gfo/Idh/MocA family oxidoreductase [Lentisphaerota bacterium]